MKYYSEKLDKLFDTPEELEAAEKPKKKKAVAVKEVPVEETPVTETAPTKKQLAAEVELADEQLREAYANYNAAKEQAEELSKQYLTEIAKILEPAQKNVKECEQKRYEAIRKFNDSFGAYQVTYTGAKAADEMMKAISNINAHVNRTFRDMFWI